jgi:peptide/nickel transport system substrate-binding protein
MDPKVPIPLRRRRHDGPWSLTVIAVCWLLSGCFLLGWGCSGEQQQPESESVEGDRYGGTLVVGISGDVDGLNPVVATSAGASNVMSQLYLSLARMNEHMEFKPQLATSWEFSQDHLELTYHLRDDVVWADGVPLTATDIRLGYELYTDPIVASPRIGNFDFIDDMVVIDDHTVKFIFSQAYPDQVFDSAIEAFPAHILSQVDRSQIRMHPFNRDPLGCGPFRLKRWVSQQLVELVPNEKYYLGRPYLDRVIFRIIPDQTSLLTQLETGEIDLMEQIPPRDVARIQKNNPDVKIYTTSGRSYTYIGWNNRHPLFQSAKVRRALTMAIDIDDIIESLLYGYGKRCLGPIPPILEWAFHQDIEPICYDPQGARRLLADEGWTDSDGDGWLDRNGRRFEFTMKTNLGNREREDAVVIIQNDLEQIGIKVIPKIVEWTVFLDQVHQHDFEAYLSGWRARMSVDPTSVWHSKSVDELNYVYYSNPEVDRLIERGREIMSREEARPVWLKFQELIYQDQPYTFLFWRDQVIGIHRRFQDCHPIPLSIYYHLENWWVPKGERKY